LTHPAVDLFAQEVGMTVVTGVLLDHVNEYLAQRDSRSLPEDPKIGCVAFWECDRRRR
jgi:hypothetical protein